MDHQLNRLTCWWFGCVPHSGAVLYHDDQVMPCERCGAPDCSYADLVGDTRHSRMMGRIDSLTWLLVRRWLPQKCYACGSRGKCKPDCDGVPF